MTDHSIPPSDALVEAVCAWCGASIYGCKGNWHTLDGGESCHSEVGLSHVPEEELTLDEITAPPCRHLDDHEILDGHVYCGDCGEEVGDG